MSCLASSGLTRSVKTAACRPESTPALVRVSCSSSTGVWPDGMFDREARGHPAHQPGDPDHEELVQVGGEDGEEAHPLKQRDLIVFRELEDALVELDPALLPVQVAVGGKLRRPGPPRLAGRRGRCPRCR